MVGIIYCRHVRKMAGTMQIYPEDGAGNVGFFFKDSRDNVDLF
jgi:hypothetical protein